MENSSLVFEQGITNFTLELYGTIEKSGNEVLSPFSFSAALLFLMLGTDGTTKAQIKTSIFKNEDIRYCHASFAELSDLLMKRTMNGVTLSVANRLFGKHGFLISENYTTKAILYYNSEFEQTDFATQPEESRLRINSWISTETNNKIDDMIPGGAITSDTVMVLVNAIYFKGTWRNQFDPKETKKMNFYVNENVQKQIDMMNRKGVAASGENLALNCKVLQLPYLGGNLSMLIILPNNGNGLSQLESQLNSVDTLNDILSSLTEQETMISIPKFSIVANYELKQVLTAMGITEIFDSMTADFSRLTLQDAHLYVSEIRHKAFIEVNEEGSEAAAATTVEMGRFSALPTPFEFKADHPFLFMIREHESGTILFIGRYVDP